MLQWIREHDGLLWSLGGTSLAILIAGVVVIPALVVRIPPDYFMHEKRELPAWVNRRPFIKFLVVAGKNILGGVLILASIAGFLLPGLGVVTLVIGLFLVDFPGKYRFMKWLIGRRFIHGPVNRLRKRRGGEPIQFK